MTDAIVAAPLQVAFRTDPGRVRANNEDLPLVDAPRGVFGVIDGVGGSAAGEVAAAIARDVILHRLSRPLGTPHERVREAIAIANNEIFRRSERAAELRGMSCVITLAILGGDLLTIGHVGDSRLYVLGPTGLRKLTHDHSPVGEREDAAELTELEAMRHPRRNELFRDVGGALHDKDDEEFVEVIEVPWEGTEALLLCTDGLTDMVPSTAIERIVRRYAGQPQLVVDALVDAANEAGGADNVTVVYAESAAFAARSIESRAAAAQAPAASSARTPGGRGLRWVGGLLWAFAVWVVRSRTTWFAVGAVAGVAAVLGLMWRVGDPGPARSRTLVAGTAVAGGFSRVEAALATARPGDVVQLEPGVYAERIVVPDGVDLVARVPGSVTIRRGPGGEEPSVGVTALGAHGGRISGLRIESTPDAPIDVGIRVSGQDRTIELVDVLGPVQTALELLPSSSVTVRGSRLDVPALALRAGDAAQATFTQNILSRTGRDRGPAVQLEGSAHLQLSRNVLAGFGPSPVTLDGRPAAVSLDDNLVVATEPRGARRP